MRLKLYLCLPFIINCKSSVTEIDFVNITCLFNETRNAELHDITYESNRPKIK